MTSALLRPKVRLSPRRVRMLARQPPRAGARARRRARARSSSSGCPPPCRSRRGAPKVTKPRSAAPTRLAWDQAFRGAGKAGGSTGCSSTSRLAPEDADSLLRTAPTRTPAAVGVPRVAGAARAGPAGRSSPCPSTRPRCRARRTGRQRGPGGPRQGRRPDPRGRRRDLLAERAHPAETKHPPPELAACAGCWRNCRASAEHAPASCSTTSRRADPDPDPQALENTLNRCIRSRPPPCLASRVRLNIPCSTGCIDDAALPACWPERPLAAIAAAGTGRRRPSVRRSLPVGDTRGDGERLLFNTGGPRSRSVVQTDARSSSPSLSNPSMDPRHARLGRRRTIGGAARGRRRNREAEPPRPALAGAARARFQLRRTRPSRLCARHSAGSAARAHAGVRPQHGCRCRPARGRSRAAFLRHRAGARQVLRQASSTRRAR